MINLKELTIKKAHEAMVGGEYSAVDLANAYLDNIKKKDLEGKEGEIIVLEAQ